MNQAISPTPPTSPSLYGEKVSAGNNHFYALAHWCDKTNKWIMAVHKFIMNKTSGGTIGQFITSSWFDCYIYPGKTFLVICAPNKWSIKAIEKQLNTDTSVKKMHELFHTIESFTSPNLDKYLYTKDEGALRVELEGIKKKNTLSLKLHRTYHYKSQHDFFCSLPSFNFKN